jgi:hypothetical protein
MLLVEACIDKFMQGFSQFVNFSSKFNCGASFAVS